MFAMTRSFHKHVESTFQDTMLNGHLNMVSLHEIRMPMQKVIRDGWVGPPSATTCCKPWSSSSVDHMRCWIPAETRHQVVSDITIMSLTSTMLPWNLPCCWCRLDNSSCNGAGNHDHGNYTAAACGVLPVSLIQTSYQYRYFIECSPISTSICLI